MEASRRRIQDVEVEAPKGSFPVVWYGVVLCNSVSASVAGTSGVVKKFKSNRKLKLKARAKVKVKANINSKAKIKGKMAAL